SHRPIGTMPFTAERRANATRSRRSLRLRRLLTDLQDADAAHVQPILSVRMRHTYEHTVAGWAAKHRPHPMHIRGQCADSMRRAAADAGDLGNGHLVWKDRMQNTTSRVAIKLSLHHSPPAAPAAPDSLDASCTPAAADSPVGPNRSVLIRADSYPSVTRLAAA